MSSHSQPQSGLDHNRSDVCLVQMPFATLETPSLALGLLKAQLTRAGITCQAFHESLRFAEMVGLDRYHMFDESIIQDLLGEWAFAPAAFPHHKRDDDGYFSSVKLSYARPILEEVRAAAPAFVEQVAHRVLERRPRIVGCSSNFMQHCASLALLRVIRELDPSVVTVLGGANCEGAMGRVAADSFPWVDIVVSGEADDLVVPLFRALMEDSRQIPDHKIPAGVMRATRKFGVIPPVTRATVENLDALPIPDFSDYFDDLARSPLCRYVKPGLTVETSRGCWWGEKHHCTFCGLNGHGMAYRSKGADRVMAELQELQQTSGLTGFQMTDNILDMSYLQTLLPHLKGNDTPLRLFFETKSNLRRRHIRDLAEAGIRWIQPGIESLSDEALGLLDKGSRGWMNVQLLKWAWEEGTYVTWNFLAGIPGEQDAWYAAVAEWLPLISHLQPPAGGQQGVVSIRFDRFSPYHQRPEDWGLDLVPCAVYGHIYPLAQDQLHALAYFFEDRAGGGPVERPGLDLLRARIVEWQRQYTSPTRATPQLTAIDSEDAIEIVDTRSVAVRERWTLEGMAARIYRACDEGRTLAGLRAELSRHPETDDADEPFDVVLQGLVESRLIARFGEYYLSLATGPQRHPLPGPADFPGGYLLLRRRRKTEAPRMLPADVTVEQLFG